MGIGQEMKFDISSLVDTRATNDDSEEGNNNTDEFDNSNGESAYVSEVEDMWAIFTKVTTQWRYSWSQQATGTLYTGENDTVCIDNEEEDPFVDTPRYESMKPSEDIDFDCEKEMPMSTIRTQNTRDDLFQAGSEKYGSQGRHAWCDPFDNPSEQPIGGRRCLMMIERFQLARIWWCIYPSGILHARAQMAQKRIRAAVAIQRWLRTLIHRKVRETCLSRSERDALMQ